MTMSDLCANYVNEVLLHREIVLQAYFYELQHVICNVCCKKMKIQVSARILLAQCTAQLHHSFMQEAHLHLFITNKH
jgi:hypothetical protein